MKASDYIAQALYEYGVRQVFEVVGGMTAHMVDSLHRLGQIRIVSVHHEQAAAFAADGAGRFSGIPGVAIATSGPGATNLLTGVASCYFDSTPAVFITGQVNRHERKADRAIRQLGFQETDIVAMAKPVTKASFSVDDPTSLPRLLAEAFALASGGRPGPVLVDIPMDVQRANLDIDHVLEHPLRRRNRVAADTIEELERALHAAVRPLVIAGGGIRTAGAVKEFRSFVDSTRLPVASSLMGLDVLPFDHPCRVGMLGSYGNRWANLAIARSDMILVAGSRLDVRQTGSDTEAFKGDRTILHVDCESGEINNRVLGCEPIVADLQDFFSAVSEASQRWRVPTTAAWMAEINDLRNKWPDEAELGSLDGINPNSFMHELSRASASARAYAVDVGQHQMWAAQSLELGAEQRFFTSGGLGAMGFALPAAVGISMCSKAPVVVIAGDGGFQLNIQELQTVVRNELPLKLVVLDNQCHGMVRQFQKTYFGERYHSTVWGYSAPAFARVAETYGIPAQRVDAATDVGRGLAALWEFPEQPFLLHVKIGTMLDVYPKIAYGHPISEMEPFAQPKEMEGA